MPCKVCTEIDFFFDFFSFFVCFILLISLLGAATHSPERNKLGTSSPERKVSKPKAKSRPQSPDRVIDNNNFLDTVPFKDGRLASDYTYKVIIIGDSGVGKSNIINRWMGMFFF